MKLFKSKSNNTENQSANNIRTTILQRQVGRTSVFPQKSQPTKRNIFGFAIMGLISNSTSMIIYARSNEMAVKLKDNNLIRCSKPGDNIMTFGQFLIAYSIFLIFFKFIGTNIPPFFGSRILAIQIYEVLGILLTVYSSRKIIYFGIACLAYSYAIQDTLYLQYGRYFKSIESEIFSICSHFSIALFALTFSLMKPMVEPFSSIMIYIIIKFSVQFLTHSLIIKHPVKIHQFKLNFKKQSRIRTLEYPDEHGRMHPYPWPPFSMKEQFDLLKNRAAILIIPLVTFSLGFCGMVYLIETFPSKLQKQPQEFMILKSMFFCGLASGRAVGLIERLIQKKRIILLILLVLLILQIVQLIVGMMMTLKFSYAQLLSLIFFSGFINGTAFDFSIAALRSFQEIPLQYHKVGEIIVLSFLESISSLLGGLIAFVLEVFHNHDICDIISGKNCDK